MKINILFFYYYHQYPILLLISFLKNIIVNLIFFIFLEIGYTKISKYFYHSSIYLNEHCYPLLDIKTRIYYSNTLQQMYFSDLHGFQDLYFLGGYWFKFYFNLRMYIEDEKFGLKLLILVIFLKDCSLIF